MIDQKHKKLTLGNVEFPSMDYEQHQIKGVGCNRYPIVNMDKFIDHSYDDILHLEVCKGLAKASHPVIGGGIYGGLPPEVTQNFNNNDSFDVMLRNLEKYDPTGHHLAIIEDLARESSSREEAMLHIGKYAYYALGAIIPWFFLLYLKKSTFNGKSSDSTSVTTPDSKHFPKLMEYTNSLPFKTIGRIVFFTTFPNCAVPTHRDSIVAEHKDHNINLFFSGARKSFVYDPLMKQKIYLDQSAKSYFFNNRDYHGVDAEPVFRYTLRIDGTFKDEVCEELGLINGYTWKWDYEKNNPNLGSFSSN